MFGCVFEFVCVYVREFVRVYTREFVCECVPFSTGACTDIMTSDHSPLFASFQVGGVKQYVPEAGNGDSYTLSSKYRMCVWLVCVRAWPRRRE